MLSADDQPQNVVLFSGHMIDAPDRKAPRFPAGKESAAAAAIAATLHDIGAGRGDLGICGGACGGDLLFAEACLARGMRLEIYIPLDEPEFLAASVDFAGGNWHDRYFAAKAKATLHVAPEELGPPGKADDPYERNNQWMKGWKTNRHVDFDFEDAHDLNEMTSRAQNEQYVKNMLKGRMKQSEALVVLVGESTKNLFKFVRWEIELAMEMDIPIIVANLNNRTEMDPDRCPAILRNECAIHVPFKMEAIKYALQEFPSAFRRMTAIDKAQGWRYYNRPDWYRAMGL